MQQLEAVNYSLPFSATIRVIGVMNPMGQNKSHVSKTPGMNEKGGPAHACTLSFFVDITTIPPKSNTHLVGNFLKPCHHLLMSKREPPCSLSDSAFLASLSLAMQLHHLHSLPCYKAHPGTMDLGFFGCVSPNKLQIPATMRALLDLPNSWGATSFNSIHYTHP